MTVKEGIYCFLLCFGYSAPAQEVRTIDTFCQAYVRQVISKEEVDAVRKLPRQLRDRIQGNDLDYLCRCLNWNDPVCKGRGLTGQ